MFNVGAYTYKIVKCFKTFKLFAFLPPSIYINNMYMVINELRKVYFYSKSYRRYLSHKIYILKLIYSFYSILGYILVLLCYFCFFRAIAYAFIFNIVDIVAYQVFSLSWEVKISKIFMPDCKSKLDTCWQLYLWLNLLIVILLDPKKGFC